MSDNKDVKTILILAANPSSTSRLRLDEEVREIEEGLRRGNVRDRFQVEQKWAVRSQDFYRAILDTQPQIVHFCGHGSGEDGLVLESDTGQVELLRADELASMFRLFATESVECVVLNACYSRSQAEGICKYVNYVIGTSQTIGDRSAVTFATAFYDALAAGKSIQFAFELGCSRLVGLEEDQTPVLLTKQPVSVSSQATRRRIFISYKRDVEPDEALALQVYQQLSQHHDVFIDQRMLVGTRWVERIEAELCQADFLIVFLSARSVHSEMVEWEIRKAHELAQVQGGKPGILPVRLAYREPFHYPLSAYLDSINWAFWQREEDTSRLIAELMTAVAGGKLSIGKKEIKAELLEIEENRPSLPRPFSSAQPVTLEMPEGTMDSQSEFYIERASDAIALRTIQQKGVTITIKGARQVGKSSLLIRTMKAAEEARKRVAFLDFQLFDKAALIDAELFFRRFCFWITDMLEMEDRVEEYWKTPLGNSQRCTRYVQRYLLKELGCPLVLAMDEVDKIFSAEFRNDFFSMLRSWHNSRATTPIWKKLDLTGSVNSVAFSPDGKTIATGSSD
ncbi:MAG: AAA-like domain-containing protein, partial [Scytonema sp. PMC 1070.18]|nr:AAA-like domain-containing protein [Scytonema sp. PMC 1070.18]